MIKKDLAPDVEFGEDTVYPKGTVGLQKPVPDMFYGIMVVKIR